MDIQKYVPTAIALGLVYAIAKFAPNPMVKAAAYGAMGVIVLKQVPFVGPALA